MKKLLLVIVIVLVAAALIWMVKDSVISHYLSNKLGISLSMQEVSIWPSRIKLSDLRLKNPSGYKKDTAFLSKKTVIQYDYSEIKGDPSIINEIDFNNVYLVIECTNGMCKKNNWTELASMKANNQKGMTLKKVNLNNITIDVFGKGPLLKPETLRKIDHLEFNDIESDSGFPMQALIKAIFQAADLKEYITNIPPAKGGPVRRAIRMHRINKAMKEEQNNSSN